MEAIEARTTAKYVRISPRKVQVVCDLIRGKDVGKAYAILMNTPKAASETLVKMLRTAVANAENNLGMDTDSLYISQIYANGGPIIKRMMPRAQGRGYRINKRTSHITIVLSERV